MFRETPNLTLYKHFLDRYYELLKVLLTLLLAIMLVPVALQILSRYVGIVPRYIWTEEAARFCFVWMIMVGSVVAVREASHFEVDVLPTAKTLRTKGWMRLIVHLAMGTMALAFLYYGFEFARSGARQKSEMSGLNMLAIYVSFPLAGLSWLLFLGERMVDDILCIRRGEEGGGG